MLAKVSRWARLLWCRQVAVGPWAQRSVYSTTSDFRGKNEVCDGRPAMGSGGTPLASPDGSGQSLWFWLGSLRRRYELPSGAWDITPTANPNHKPQPQTDFGEFKWQSEAPPTVNVMDTSNDWTSSETMHFYHLYCAYNALVCPLGWLDERSAIYTRRIVEGVLKVFATYKFWVVNELNCIEFCFVIWLAMIYILVCSVHDVHSKFTLNGMVTITSPTPYGESFHSTVLCKYY